MRTSSKLGSLVAAVAATALTAGLFAGPAAAAAASHPVLYTGFAGASQVTLADGTVTSGLTAPSAIQGTAVPADNSNHVASVAVPDLIGAGAATSDTSISSDGGATTLISHAETANLSLLGGLITADAVDTTATTTFTGSDFDTVASTQFVNLKIAKVHLPIDIGRNFTVTLPGVATVVLNSTQYFQTDSAALSIGAAVYIKLLDGRGDSPLGSQIYLNPTYSAIITHIPNTPVVLGGEAFATQVNATVLGVNLGIDKTAYQALGAKGTDGKVVTNSTVGVSLPNILTTGVVSTTVRGVTTNTTGDAQTTAAVAKLHVLNGLVKAKAIKAVARVTLQKSGNIITRHSTRLVGLTIAGHAIPINVAPNTRMDVAGLGVVFLNEQSSTAFSSSVDAIRIVVTAAGLGLPIGATVIIGSASAYILS